MDPPLPIDGVLPPDLQGTLLRAGPGRSDGGDVERGGARGGGALHAVELRDGSAVSYRTCESAADATAFWHAGSVLALPETGIPQQYSRALEPEDFGSGLTLPIASHAHRDPVTGGRVIFGVDQGPETTVLRVGEWDANGALTSHLALPLERATWQHDIGITQRHLVVIESPTEHSGALEDSGEPVPYRWVPGSETWVAVVARGGDGSDARWFRVDPCLVTHVLHAHEEGTVGGGGGERGREGGREGGRADGGADGAIVLYVCCYPVPEKGQPVDLDASVLGPAGIGQSLIGGGLPVLERWRIVGDRLERVQVDERFVEYPRCDPVVDAGPFRHGYGVEMARGASDGGSDGVDHLGLLRFDMARDHVTTWSPGPLRTASEPLFVRAVDGQADDEGWLLTVVHDATRGASDLYVLDASSLSVRSRPLAVVHLPVPLPFRSHGEWVGAERYR